MYISLLPRMDTRNSVKRSFAIIGAGVSGLSCATALADDKTCKVTIMEKARDVSGRLSTRRTTLSDSTQIFHDHGAQYFTVRNPLFKKQNAEWIKEGVVREWKGGIYAYSRESGDFLKTSPGTVRYIGCPANNSIGKHMESQLGQKENAEIWVNTRVRSLEKQTTEGTMSHRWKLVSETGDNLGVYDHVIISTPVPQTLDLLPEDEGCSLLREQISKVKMLPTWALMIAFKERIDVPFDGVFMNKRAGISWIARNTSKPDRQITEASKEYECWVVHAHPEWSEENLERSAAEVKCMLMGAFEEAIAPYKFPCAPAFATAHRWRFANFDAIEPFPDYCLSSESLGLSFCGDWCGGSRIEGAYVSGYTLGKKLVATPSTL